MKLKMIVDSLDEVDAAFHPLYTERDGKFHLTEIEGIRSQSDVNNLQGALTKERNDHKAAKDALKKFEGLNADTITADLAELAALRESGGKENPAVIEAKVNAAKAPLDRRIKELEGINATLETENAGLKGDKKTHKIHSAVRSAATKAKLVDGAVDDALLYAERHLDVDDAGNVVTKDTSGITAGLSPDDWLADMVKKRQHWLPPSSGGGANPGGGGKVTENPWTFENWNMTAQGKILTENPQRAEALAKAAGTTIGGAKPAPKKA